MWSNKIKTANEYGDEVTLGERVLCENKFFDAVETCSRVPTKTLTIVSKTDGLKVFDHNYNNCTILYTVIN